MFGRAATSCSFTAGTLVLMADGSTKPIGAIATGDKVESGDPATTANHAETVTLVHDNLDTDLTDLTITDSAGHTSTIHTTQNHPFWDQTSQEWTPAGQLRPGDQLRTPTGLTARVAAVTNTVGLNEMLNLTVTDYHTYYVMAGATPVLVHNTGACPDHGPIRKCPSLCVHNGGPGLPGKDAPGRDIDDEVEQQTQEALEAGANAIDAANNLSQIMTSGVKTQSAQVIQGATDDQMQGQPTVGGIEVACGLIAAVLIGAVRRARGGRC